MHEIEVKRHLEGAELIEVTDLLEAATEADAHPALGEHAWIDLVQGGRAGFAGLLAWEEGHDHPVGYAQLDRGEGDADGTRDWSLEVVVDPHHRTPGNTVGAELVSSATTLIADEGGGHLHFWVSRPAPYHYRLAEKAGLAPGRSLYQMRCALPVNEHASITTRAFVPGQDEEAWLELNNQAFDWHPEQGGWTLETLRSRQSQPWFDPEGFLLYEEAGRLAGFCWTKVYDPGAPAHTAAHGHNRSGHHHVNEATGGGPLGELYVVAVRPDLSGRGLGRQLTLAGLDYLSAKGLKEAMLYVDAGNRRAVRLYISIGFTMNHVDMAFTGDIAPRDM